MAYDNTSVPVSRSQESIRKLIMAHAGFGTSFTSYVDPQGVRPPQEGFTAAVMIDKQPYQVKVMATVKKTKGGDVEREVRRVWRVLFYYMKSMYDASDTGVMEFRELMLPFILTANKQTIAERLMSMIGDIVTNPVLMLTEGATQ